jgi:AcrR family transcriptional regulator
LLSRGYRGSSIRLITDEAGANVASINYHFGSKRELFAELFRRRLCPVTQRRTELLQGIEAGSSNSVEEIVQAYFGTLFQYRQQAGENVAAVISMLLNGDPEVSQLASESLGDGYADLRHRYASVLANAIPNVPLIELEWRLEVLERFALCVMAGPNVGWAARTLDPAAAGDACVAGGLSDGLLGIIQACIEAPQTVSAV